MEWSGVEWSGVEWSGVEWSEVDLFFHIGFRDYFFNDINYCMEACGDANDSCVICMCVTCMLSFADSLCVSHVMFMCVKNSYVICMSGTCMCKTTLM